MLVLNSIYNTNPTPTEVRVNAISKLVEKRRNEIVQSIKYEEDTKV